MPLYEYKCVNCGSVIEVLQKLNDRPLHKCAQCGGTLTKLVSSSAIQFKGAGWYVTDYARKEKTSHTNGEKTKSKEKKTKAKKKPTEKNQSSTPDN